MIYSLAKYFRKSPVSNWGKALSLDMLDLLEKVQIR